MIMIMDKLELAVTQGEVVYYPMRQLQEIVMRHG